MLHLLRRRSYLPFLLVTRHLIASGRSRYPPWEPLSAVCNLRKIKHSLNERFSMLETNAKFYETYALLIDNSSLSGWFDLFCCFLREYEDSSFIEVMVHVLSTIHIRNKRMLSFPHFGIASLDWRFVQLYNYPRTYGQGCFFLQTL